VSPLPSLLSPILSPSRRILTAAPRAAPISGHPCSAPAPASSPPRPQVASKSGEAGVLACARGNQCRLGIAHQSRARRLCPGVHQSIPSSESPPMDVCPEAPSYPRDPRQKSQVAAMASSRHDASASSPTARRGRSRSVAVAMAPLTREPLIHLSRLGPPCGRG
jgi:hypothetical protein